MPETRCEYLIVGGGLTGASAVAGIREIDKVSSITLLAGEDYLPYDRPPLSKKLWTGKTQLKNIFIQPQTYYDANGVSLVPGRRALELDPEARIVVDDRGERYRYHKLLLATGGEPVQLPLPGGSLPGIFYYRTLDDYQRVKDLAVPGKSAVVVGGGFIGSEMAAALSQNGVEVTMVYPSAYLCPKVFPRDLGLAAEELFRRKGIKILKGRSPVAFREKGARLATRTDDGTELESDIVIVGIGIRPSSELAAAAGLPTRDGILVNEYLQTSRPDIYAAGDNARFPYQALGRPMRLEHWDNALNQGKCAGRNMAGAMAPYDYMPYFFSDLFELGYEAVGEVDSRLETTADWKKPFETGVIYYTSDGMVRGALMCNVWDRVETARGLIRAKAEAGNKLITV